MKAMTAHVFHRVLFRLHSHFGNSPRSAGGSAVVGRVLSGDTLDIPILVLEKALPWIEANLFSRLCSPTSELGIALLEE